MVVDALAILRKDLRVELRAREAVPAMALFTVTAFVLFHFGFDRDRLDGDVAAGTLWVTLLLATVLGVNRLYAGEREQGGLEAMLLAPIDRTAIFLAKAAALLLYLVALELVAVPAFGLLLLGPDLGGAVLVKCMDRHVTLAALRPLREDWGKQDRKVRVDVDPLL